MGELRYTVPREERNLTCSPFSQLTRFWRMRLKSCLISMEKDNAKATTATLSRGMKVEMKASTQMPARQRC